MAKAFRVLASVHAVIRRGGSALVVRRSAQSPQNAGVWDIPGGAVEEGESLEGALFREVFEETGLKPSISHVCTAELSYWRTPRGRTYPRVEVNYV